MGSAATERALLVALRGEDGLELAEFRRGVADAVVTLLGVGGEVVHLEDGFGGRRGERVRLDAVVGVPFVEALVVVVELPQLGVPPSPVGRVVIDRLDVDG